MIDVHSHVVFGVDDGPSTMEESLRMISEAEELGVKVIIATPHYQEKLFDTDRVISNYQELVYRAGCYDVSIRLGREVLLSHSMISDIKNMKSLTLDNSKYLLFEFPFNAVPIYAQEAVYRLQLENITPVIAHPERCKNFLYNMETFKGFIKAGCLVQLDAASVIGIYGRAVREFAKRLIKMDMVDFVASDAHNTEAYSDWFRKAYMTVIQWAGKETADRMFFTNAEAIVNCKERKKVESCTKIAMEMD